MRIFVDFLLNTKKWGLPLLIIFIISIMDVLVSGVHTYTQALPILSCLFLFRFTSQPLQRRLNSMLLLFHIYKAKKIIDGTNDQ